ncbi:helix-turn-helix domain-containing protein [Myxococcota bacterium]
MPAQKKLELLKAKGVQGKNRHRDRATRWRTPFDRSGPSPSSVPHSHDELTDDMGNAAVTASSSEAEVSWRDRLTDLVSQLSSELRHLGELFENRIDDSPFCDIEGAARFLRIKPTSVERYAKRERLLPYHVLGRKLVFHRDDLIKFMQRCRRPGVDG